MKYILMDYVNEAGWPAVTKGGEKSWLGSCIAYIAAMKTAGILKSNTGLQPTSSATTVNEHRRETEVLDTDYAESKEQLGGLRIVEVADLHAAPSWAARCPTAS